MGFFNFFYHKRFDKDGSLISEKIYENDKEVNTSNKLVVD